MHTVVTLGTDISNISFCHRFTWKPAVCFLLWLLIHVLLVSMCCIPFVFVRLLCTGNQTVGYTFWYILCKTIVVVFKMQCLKRFIILRCRMIFSPSGSMRESIVCYNVFPITCMKDSLNYFVFSSYNVGWFLTQHCKVCVCFLLTESIYHTSLCSTILSLVTLHWK